MSTNRLNNTKISAGKNITAIGFLTHHKERSLLAILASSIFLNTLSLN
jgi:primosomal replication protein N